MPDEQLDALDALYRFEQAERAKPIQPEEPVKTNDPIQIRLKDYRNQQRRVFNRIFGSSTNKQG